MWDTYYSQIMSPVPLCLKNWGIMAPGSYGRVAHAAAADWSDNKQLQLYQSSVTSAHQAPQQLERVVIISY